MGGVIPPKSPFLSPSLLLRVSFNQLVSATSGPVMTSGHGSVPAASQQSPSQDEQVHGSQSPAQAGHMIGQPGQLSPPIGASVSSQQ
jgi:hypothetical protein